MRACINLNSYEMTIGVFKNVRVPLRVDEKGHLRISIRRGIKKEIWWEGNVKNSLEDKQERKKILKRLHVQFGHPSKERLGDLIKDAYRDEMEDETLRDIKEDIGELSDNCEVCIRYKKTPSRPTVGLSLAKRFNETVAMDLGELEGNKFLVMLDLGTGYCQASWVKNKEPKEIVGKILERWISIFGAPERIISDNGLEFQNEEMKLLCERFNIKQLATAAESPWSNGRCEKMVGLLKDSMRKMKEEGCNKETCLLWSIGAKNWLLDKGGYSPNQLVFGRNGKLPNNTDEEETSIGVIGTESEQLKKTIEGIQKAREAHVKQEAEDRVKRAMKGQIREHKLELAEPGEEVYYKREIDNNWRGPAKVIGRDGKTVIVKHGGTLREIARVHITRLAGIEQKDEKESDVVTNEDDNDPSEEVDQIGDEQKTNNIIVNEEDEGQEVEYYRMQEEEEQQHREEDEIDEEAEERRVAKVKIGKRYKATKRESGDKMKLKILSRAGKATSKKWSDSFNVQNIENGEESWIDFRDLTDVEEINDQEEVWLCNRLQSERVLRAKLCEIENWEENDVFKRVKDKGQKRVSLRWVITEKIKDGEEKCKARLVARGFEEEGAELITESPTCSGEVLRMCLTIMKMKGWKCNSIDIKTAYLQGDRIKRKVWVIPPKEAKEKGLWELKKTVYGLKDAARVWFDKGVSIITELGGVKSKLEPALFVWKKEGKMIGIMCTHVDDFCFGGNKEFFEKIITGIKSRLRIGTEEVSEFKYIGINIEEREEGVWLEQNKYIDDINIPESREFFGSREMEGKELTLYRSLVGQMNWISCQTRPDLSYYVSERSRYFRGGKVEEMRKVINILKRAKNMRVGILLGKLKDRVEIEVFTDASYGNSIDESPQIGYIVALKDNEGNRSPIVWKSKCVRRVARSTIEAEAIGLIEGIEAGIFLSECWLEMMGGDRLKVKVYTDSKTLKTAIYSETKVLSKNLRIDLAWIKWVLEMEKIEGVEWVTTKCQIADVFTQGRVDSNLIKEYVEGKRGGERKI